MISLAEFSKRMADLQDSSDFDNKDESYQTGFEHAVILSKMIIRDLEAKELQPEPSN